MPPKKLTPKAPQQSQQSQPSPPKQAKQPKQQSQNAQAPKTTGKPASDTKPASSEPAIPENEVKQSSSMSAQLALEAAKKAYELRQAAYGAGDPNAREEILAQAINKEIEAESFGKAAKYTRSGAFQGLAAGAGLGVNPGVTLGKLTGALVGGVVASVGAVLGGGVGSVYGAINGPMWDLGQMASHGVRTITGDFPNWEATSSQKKALEKMVMGAQKTQAPNQDELEEMRDDDGDGTQEDYKRFAQALTTYIPGMPSMPSMPSMPNMPSMPSLPGMGGASQPSRQTSAGTKTATTTAPNQTQQPKPPANSQAASQPQQGPPKPASSQPQAAAQPQAPQPRVTRQSAKSPPNQKADESATKRKPKKLESRSTDRTPPPSQPAARKAPAKLESRNSTATANA